MKKEKPKGRTPSLIGGSNGKPKLVTAQRKSSCYRCHGEIASGVVCFDIPKLGAGFATSKRMCRECFEMMLQKTADDLEELRKL